MINVYVHSVDDVIKNQLRAQRDARDRQIVFWFHSELKNSDSLFKNWKDSCLIDEGFKIDYSELCYVWNKKQQECTCVSKNYLSLIFKEINQVPLDNFYVLDKDLGANCKLILFKDAPHITSSPDKFYNFQVFSDFASIKDHAIENGLLQFSLEDETKFALEPGINKVKGAKVYRELKTHYLWYKDTLHTPLHYEVFEPTGQKHIGEADERGVIDLTKKDKSKHAIV